MFIRPAIAEDAETLARLINMAGEGIPEYLWQGMAELGQSAMEVGAQRAGRDEGGFSYTNAWVAVDDGLITGMLLSYRQDDPYDTGDLAECPDFIRPLLVLESKAPGSWYVNAIAIEPGCRGQGIGTELLGKAEELAIGSGTASMSLIVAAENTGAKRLYELLGYVVNAALPVEPWPGCEYGGDWLLMVKRLR